MHTLILMGFVKDTHAMLMKLCKEYIRLCLWDFVKDTHVDAYGTLYTHARLMELCKKVHTVMPTELCK